MKKLLTLIAGLAASFGAQSQLIYYDVDPDTVITGLVTYDSGDPYMLDIDQNGTIDYHLMKVSYDLPDPAWDFGYIQDGGSGPGTNEYLGGDIGESIRSVFNLEAGDAIDATGSWETVSGGNSQFVNVFPAAALDEGPWNSDDDGYAAFRFDSSGTECYAWVRMGFAADNSTMTIKEWAYSCSGDLDSAGQMPAPPCEAPVDLTATALTINSADLGWTELNGATEWEVEYGEGGFGTGTGTSVITSSNPLSVTGLMDDTDYDFYVRSICGAGDTSEWSVLGNFETVLDDAGVGGNILINMTVYPNPAKEQVNFEFNMNISGVLAIYDVLGQQLNTFELDGQSTVQVNVSMFPKGRYIYQLSAEQGLFNGQLLIE